MITLDTSGVIALLNRKDPDHAPARAPLLEDPGPWLVPAGILAEGAYLVETNLRLEVLEAWLDDLETGVYTLECGEEDHPRACARRIAPCPPRSSDTCWSWSVDCQHQRLLSYLRRRPPRLRAAVAPYGPQQSR